MNAESPHLAEQFEALRPSLVDGGADWRQMAFDRFTMLGLPSQKREAWRYTPLRALKGNLPEMALDSAAINASIADHKIDGALHIAFVGVLQGAGATNTSLGINFVGTVIFQVPLSILLGFTLDLGAFGVWLSFPLSFLVKAALGWAAYKRGGWIVLGKRI